MINNLTLLNKELNVEECGATGDDSSNAGGFPKKHRDSP